MNGRHFYRIFFVVAVVAAAWASSRLIPPEGGASGAGAGEPVAAAAFPDSLNQAFAFPPASAIARIPDYILARRKEDAAARQRESAARRRLLAALPAASSGGQKSDAPPAAAPDLRTEASGVPAIGARAFIVEDGTGAVSVSSRANLSWPMASITKLMTAVVALKLGRLDDLIAVSSTDPVADDGPNQRVAAGEIYSLRDLLHLLLLPSSNGAAEAIARFYGRGPFIAAMNAQAAAWGLADTRYADPSGLSPLDVSTPADVARLARRIKSGFPLIFEITRDKGFVVTDRASGSSRVAPSINEFAGRPDFLGGKTGYTEQADENLLSLFSRGDSYVVIAVFGTNDRFGDTLKLLNWFDSIHN